MRVRVWALAALAVLLLASVAVGAFALRGSGQAPASECRPAADRSCQAPSGCDPRRPACQESQRQDRLRAYCADHPRDAKCR